MAIAIVELHLTAAGEESLDLGGGERVPLQRARVPHRLALRRDECELAVRAGRDGERYRPVVFLRVQRALAEVGCDPRHVEQWSDHAGCEPEGAVRAPQGGCRWGAGLAACLELLAVVCRESAPLGPRISELKAQSSKATKQQRSRLTQQPASLGPCFTRSPGRRGRGGCFRAVRPRPRRGRCRGSCG